MADSIIRGPLLYRGTSSGWPGNPVLQALRITPTTTDPLVAALFAIECRRFGKGIFLVCPRSEVERRLGPANVLSEFESEVVVNVAPAEFAERFAHWTMAIENVREILLGLGFEVPEFIGDKRVLNDWLTDAKRLSTMEIAEFDRRLMLEIVQ